MYAFEEEEEEEESRRGLPRSRKVSGAFAKTPAGLRKREWFLFLCCACCCCLILLTLGILGTIGFAGWLDLKNDQEDRVDHVKFCVDMTGCKEKPFGSPGNPPSCDGDPNGFGVGAVEVWKGDKNEVCVNAIVSAIGTPVTAIHIHGPISTADPQVVGIFVPEDMSSFDVTPEALPGPGTQIQACVLASASAVAAIFADPDLFYINVHNGAFPDGALRDMLGNICDQ